MPLENSMEVLPFVMNDIVVYRDDTRVTVTIMVHAHL